MCAAAAGAALLAWGALQAPLSVAAPAPGQPARANQPTVTATPTHWQAQASVFGRVVAADSTDTPIEGARVILHAGDNRCDQSVVTDPTGTFDLSCYDLHFENQFAVHVVAADYQPWRTFGGLLYYRIELNPMLVRIASTPQPTPTAMDFESYVITTGTVRDAADGRPLPNVRVSLGDWPSCLTPVRTDDSGRYELVCPAVGSLSQYFLAASTTGYADWSRELSGHHLGGVIDIAMERAGTRTLWIPACSASRAAQDRMAHRPPGPLITPTVTPSPTLRPLDPTPLGVRWTLARR